MDENLGAQYALQVALQTMKERCQSLQKRVTALEEENVTLKLKCCKTRDSKENSLTEIDNLKSKVAELSEEKCQLRNNVLMVAAENRQLWSRLSKLTQDNKHLGSKLSKINDSLTQHTKSHSPLIRSKTFTQEAPHTKHLQRALTENDKISLELEDISLKLLSSISKEKNELELQCSEMAQLQANEILTNSFGFPCLEECEDSMADDLEQHLQDLKYIRSSLDLEHDTLIKTLNNLETIKVESCNKCAEMKKENVSKTMIIPNENVVEDDLDVKTQLESLAQWGSPEPSDTFLLNNHKPQSAEKICPMCSQRFLSEVIFENFVKHVESHFSLDSSD